MVRAGLDYLAAAGAAQLGAEIQAGVLRELEQDAAALTAAPRVIPVRWISQETALYSASPE